MSLVTVRDHQPTRAYIEALGRALGHHVAGADHVRTEIALTLPVPQTADCALLRLCSEAPSQLAAGGVFDVWLVSRDQGLGAALTAILDAQGVSHAGSPARNVHCFRHEGRGVGSRRRFASGLGVVTTPTPPAEPRFSIDIDTAGLAAWAAARDLDLAPAEDDLCPIAEAIDARPGLLSQIGLTRHAVVGIERLVRFPASRALGPCSPQHGLEVRLAAPPAGQHARDVTPASVGNGAVRLVDLSATLASDLPYGVLDALVRQHGGAVRVKSDGSRIDDAHSLRALLSVGPVGQQCVVLLRSRRLDHVDVLSAAVKGQGIQPPSCWWVVGNPQSERKHPGLAGLVVPGTHLEVPAHVRIVTQASRPALVLQSVAAAGTHVDLPSRVAPGQLGTAHVHDQTTVAVLAGRHTLKPGRLRVSPIQDFSGAALRRETQQLTPPDREALRELPIALKGLPR